MRNAIDVPETLLSVKLSVAIALMALSMISCASPSAPTPAIGVDMTQSQEVLGGPPSIPAWIADPAVIPSGRKGKNNCTFPLGAGATGGIWDYHADGACWERSGSDGWVRQHQNVVHVPQHASCSGGPADVSPIRICREGGARQPNPCDVNTTTGLLGCAVCVRSVVCH